MKGDLNSCLSATIFLESSYFHVFFKKLIKPYFAKWQLIHCSNTIRIELCFHPREYITFEIETLNINTASAANYLNERVLSFFTDENLNAIDNFTSEDEVFMPAPTNSIFYRIYPVIENQKIAYLKIIEEMLALIMMEVLSEDIIDEELLITFSVYVIMQFLNTFIADQDLLKRYYINLSKSLLETQSMEIFVQNRYYEVIESLNDIYSEILEKKLTWISHFESLYQVRDGLKEDIDLIVFTQHFNNSLFRQLGISPLTKALIVYFVKEMIDIKYQD